MSATSDIDAVIVVEDSTLRGYARLALMHADVTVRAISLNDLVTDTASSPSGVFVLDAAAHRAVAATLVEGGGAETRRIVLLDPQNVVEEAQRTHAVCVVDRFDAEEIVGVVRDCIAALLNARIDAAAAAPEAPEPARAETPAASRVKKTLRRVLPKKGSKPKRRR